MARNFFRSKSLTKLFLCAICLGIIFFFRNKFPHTRRELLLLSILHSGEQKLAFEGQACRIPILDVNASEIMEALQENEIVTCNTTRDWVEVNGSTLKISNWAKKKYGTITCSFTDVLRDNDFVQYNGMTTTSNTEYNLEASDVVTVQCTTDNGIMWRRVLMGIRSDQEIFDRATWEKTPSDSLKLNVLILGFDSMSHNMFKRKLPKTYKYVTEDLKGIALNGYNIVGDGTPQALIPMLTGKTEIELPEVRKRMGNKAHYVNEYPFIWNDFQKNGYVTAWGEDMTHVGTFNYRMKGFADQPVDHYMRTYFREIEPHYREEEKFCYGQFPRHRIMLSFVDNMFQVYKDRPKFVFAFHSEYSHDSTQYIANADEPTLERLQEYHKKGYLEKTLLIMMSDHGARFAKLRNTQQGKQEERLPGFIFVFPTWFSQIYPKAYKNFKTNAERLTTPFDIHETLKNVLHYEGAGMGSTLKRGISLFNEVPLSRTCRAADIEPHWCSCLNWETVPLAHNSLVLKAVGELLNTINGYTSKHRDLCARLVLKKVLWGAKLIPNNQVLKFLRAEDLDGFLGDMSANTAITTEIYQVKVSFDPGDMIFEASIRYIVSENKFIVSEREISRINKYQHMTHCIEDKDILHHLRKENVRGSGFLFTWDTYWNEQLGWCQAEVGLGEPVYLIHRNVMQRIGDFYLHVSTFEVQALKI